MKKCLNCGELNENSTGFCVNCGSSELEEAASVICPVCKAEVKADADFCTECGAKFNTAIEAEKQKNNQHIDDGDHFDCPNCRNSISVTSVYCPYCGEEVNTVNTNRKVKKYICPNCGQPNDISAHFCSYCYFDLTNANIKEMSIVVKPKKVERQQFLQCVLVTDEDQEGKVVCPHCHALNTFKAEYCIKCGQSLKIDIPRKYCFVCGAENAINARFCTTCKYKFDTPAGNKYNWTCVCGCENDADADFCTFCGKTRKGLGAIPPGKSKRGG